MAKQRPQARPKKPAATPTSQTASSTETERTGAIRGGLSSQNLASPPSLSKRSTYVEAVAIYERGLEALQQHDYAKAGQLLGSVLQRFPEEKELHERVRLYLNVCQRQAVPQDVTPVTVDERLYASTLALNGGRYDEAISHLRLVRDEDPDNDYALYMLAVAHAQRGEHAEALVHLERAIALNPDNRGLAKTDPDLDTLREDEAFRVTLDTPSKPIDRRRPVRPRSGR